MKKLLVVMGLAVATTASAQLNLIPNVGVGVGVGTTGISIDASATFTDFLGARVGVDIMPKFKIDKTLDLGIEDKTSGKTVSDMYKYIDDLNARIDNYNSTRPAGMAALEKVDKSMLPTGDIPKNVDIQGKFANTTWHVLFDVYPMGKISSFHLTAGAYFGPSELISVYNMNNSELPNGLTPINQWNNAILGAEANPSSLLYTQVVQPNNLKMIGADMGDYFITPNPAENGNVKASAKVKSFRPYVGLGFGRAVPKGRVGFQFDLGCQFWGKPEVYVPTYDRMTGTYQTEKIDADKAGDDAGKILKTVSKISVYPVLNLRLVGRIL